MGAKMTTEVESHRVCNRLGRLMRTVRDDVNLLAAATGD